MVIDRASATRIADRDRTSLSISEAARERPDAIAIATPDAHATFAELAARAAVFGRFIDEAGCGLAPRDPLSRSLALVARRTLDDVALILAAIERGVPLVLLHARATEGERARLLSRVPHCTVVADATALRRSLDEAPARRSETQSLAIDAELPLAVVATSGSTGTPRAAILSRRAFLASARASAANLSLGGEDRWLAPMPLAHVGGLSVIVRALVARAQVVLTGEAPFDARAFAALARARDVTLASIVPTMLHRLVALSDEERALPAAFRTFLVGGAHASRELRARALACGIPVLTTYGLTEACSQVATQRSSDLGRLDVGSGAPLEGTEVRIVDDEILVRGPTLMSGYVGEPSPLDDDGWLPTGDLGRLDAEGNLHVLGRRDARIVTGGENVDPVEVEEALALHPRVRGAVVLGLPDPEWGQVVAACVEAVEVSREELAALVAKRLAPAKRPRLVVLVPALPLTPTGKVDREAVRRLLFQRRPHVG